MPVLQVLLLIAVSVVIGCGGAGQPPATTESPDQADGAAARPAHGVAFAEADAVLSRRPPLARREDVVDTYQGVKVVDSYRWMESPSAELDGWLDAQDARTRRALAAVPGRDRLRDELREANRGLEQVDIVRVVGARPRIFALRQGADDQTAKLVVRDGWEGADRVLVDPTVVGDGKAQMSVDSAYPSSDGKHVAYVVAESGREDGTTSIIEVDSGRILRGRIARSQLPEISWRDDNRSFFYQRRPKPRAGATPADWFKNTAVYLHRLGDDPDAAVPVIAAGSPDPGLDPHDNPWVDVRPGNRWAVATSRPSSYRPSFYVAPVAKVRPGVTRWRRVASTDDGAFAMLAHGDRLYAFTHGGAPNFRILVFDPQRETVADAKELVPESDLILVDFAGARDAMYVVALDRGVHRLFRVLWDTGARLEVVLPFAGSVGQLMVDPRRPGVAFRMEGRTRRPVWLAFDPASGLRELPIMPSSASAERGLVDVQSTVISRDGAEVPLSIIRRADQKLDGTAPAILSGYGAYGFPTNPTYSPFTVTWVRRGGIYAICHVRGSGARGEAWHRAGMKDKKENGVDDLIACAEHLIRTRHTVRDRLSVLGGSAGGLVVGGAITKRPELFRAALLRVPTVNLIRHETSPTGPRNIPEFGSVGVAAEFRSIFASDPYHRVRQGVPYPAVLLTAGRHDPRVPVWEPAKFAARLQATNQSRPILLRVEADAGHGIGSTHTQREEEFADLYAFALWQSGIPLE